MTRSLSQDVNAWTTLTASVTVRGRAIDDNVVVPGRLAEEVPLTDRPPPFGPDLHLTAGTVLGHCRQCGRELTDIASAERGYGPQCWKQVVERDPLLGTAGSDGMTQRRFARAIGALLTLPGQL